MDHGGVGIRLDLPIGKRASAYRISANEERSNRGNLTLPNHLTANNTGVGRVEVVCLNLRPWFARSLGLGIGPAATSGYGKQETNRQNLPSGADWIVQMSSQPGNR